MRILLIVFLIVSTVTVAAERVGTVSSDPDLPRIYMDPSVNVAAPGQNFTVNVVITGIAANESLYGWEFDMSFNSTVLNVTAVGQGPFLATAGDTYWTTPLIKNWKGTVEVSEGFLLFPPNGATGSGVLANITFQVLREGKAPLHFYKTELRTYNGTDVLEIDHTGVDGFFGYPLLRDVAVTGVTASPTSVSAGKPVSINVTVENQGEIAETFDVAVLYDSTEIETKTVTGLAPGGSETLSFSWDTEGLAEGNYKLTARANELRGGGETDIADNTYTDVVVAVTASSSGFPVQLFIVIVAVIIAVSVVCAGVILFTRRRRVTKQGVVASSLAKPMNRNLLKRMKVSLIKIC